jgi:hypothetical protein
LSTSINGIDGSVLVDFLNVKVAFSILSIPLPFGRGIDNTGPACNDRRQVGLTCGLVGKVGKAPWLIHDKE